jgi:hypothetical protein
MVNTFASDRYFREPSDPAYVHRGTDVGDGRQADRFAVAW